LVNKMASIKGFLIVIFILCIIGAIWLPYKVELFTTAIFSILMLIIIWWSNR